MRKSIILIIALVMCGVLSSEGWALRIQLGRHSVREIKQTCASAAGDFFRFPSGSYGCSKICAGGTGQCDVSCSSNGNCTGECPACGQDQPILRGGRNEVTGVLNNFTAIVNPVTGRWCRTESNGYQFCWTP
jgi:hypothetical protein